MFQRKEAGRDRKEAENQRYGTRRTPLRYRSSRIVKLMAAVLVGLHTPAGAQYETFGTFTLNGNHDAANPLSMGDLPANTGVRLSYVSGYFTNWNDNLPKPGYGAYAIDPISLNILAGDGSTIGVAPFGSLPGYYSNPQALINDVTNAGPFDFQFDAGGMLSGSVWPDGGATAPTTTGRGGSVTFQIDYIPVSTPDPATSQYVYLDFTGYIGTFSGQYGTGGAASQVAENIRDYLQAVYTHQDVLFQTSFDGPTPDAAITSTIHFGGSDLIPTRLGEAELDLFNTNRRDTANVYTLQPLFEAAPTRHAYENFLANVAAHEVGHLLGYSHALDFAMPFMAAGAGFPTDEFGLIPAGPLGESIQQFGLTPLEVTDGVSGYGMRVSRSASGQEVDEAVESLREYRCFQGLDFNAASEVDDVIVNIVDLAELLSIIQHGGGVAGAGIILETLEPILAPLENHLCATAFLHSGEIVHALDTAEDGGIELPVVWDEEAGMFIIELSDERLAEIEEGELALIMMLPTESVTGFSIVPVDASGNSDPAGGVGILTLPPVVPEPGALILLVGTGGLVAGRPQKKR